MSKRHVTNFRGDSFYTPDGKIHVKDEPETPIEEDFGDHNHLDLPFENDYGSMRKSMSMNDIAAMREYMDHDSSRDIYHRHRRPSGRAQELSKTKFVSMAEAIYHYHRDTPGRFHSTRPQMFRSQGPVCRSGLTVPQSPMLRSKSRSRPQHILSQEEKEAMELEELKKFKIKANPIPKSVLIGPIHLPEVSKKPITIPEPFNLTEIHKKLNEIKSPNQVPKFKARPAPKHILETPQVPVKPTVSITKPISPKFHYKKANMQDLPKNTPIHAEKPVEKPQRHGPVRPEPFSFEKHDEQRKKRKEERIRQQIEEERKQASSFKAHPLPGAVKKRMAGVTSKGCSSSTSSENKENHIKFEARPPVVLYKDPFKPVLLPVQSVKPMPFDLTTQKRAAEREKFDKLLRNKEEEIERLRMEHEREQEIAQEREQTELRAKLVHHAKPVPTYMQFVPEKSTARITVPETPKFIRRMKQTQN